MNPLTIWWGTEEDQHWNLEDHLGGYCRDGREVDKFNMYFGGRLDRT